MSFKVNLNPTPEQAELLLTWIRGRILDYYMKVQPTESLQMVMAYADRVNDTVYGYLRGHRKLDGSCSDLECDLGLRAYNTFKDIFRHEE